MTSDPIGLNGGLNTFGYILQNPLILTDPTGLDYQFCKGKLLGPSVDCTKSADFCQCMICCATDTHAITRQACNASCYHGFDYTKKCSPKEKPKERV